MRHRDVAVFRRAVRIVLEDPAHPHHSERRQFRSPQGPDAGSAEYVNAPGHRPKDFLVPDGRAAFEIAIDDPQDRRSLPCRPKNVPERRRRAVVGVQHGLGLAAVQCRPQEHDRAHSVCLNAAPPRGPIA